MPKNLEISILLDYYGQMLTEKQREVAQLITTRTFRWRRSLSLPTSPARVCRDSIKRAEGTLLEMEERLGLARKFRVYRQKLEQIVDCANEIAFEAGRYPGSRKIEQDAKKIVELAQQIED